MSVFFVILMFAYILGNVYIFMRMLRCISGWTCAVRVSVSVLFWLGATALFMAMALRHVALPYAVHSALFLIGGSWMAFALYMVPALVLADFSGLLFPKLKKCLFALAFVPVVCLLVSGNLRYRNPEVNIIDVQLDKPLPGGPVKVVAVSDVHLGFGTGKKDIRRYVDMINAQSPDVVLIGGDLIDSSVRPLHSERMDEELSALNAPLGVYMVPGNHEYISGIDDCIGFLGKTPIVLLRDSVVTLECGMQIAGRDDRVNPFRKSPGELLGSADKSKPVLLLDHQPYGLAENDALGIDVQFSGHTHDGQLWPGNLLVGRMYEQAAGWKRWEHAFVYVSSGLSLWGPPFRIGTSSDMAVLVLHGK